MAQRLPPGFRFHPTDMELVAYYLKEKINGRPIDMNPIAVVDLYKHEPWDLPAMSTLQSNDQEWYFYSARDRKYPNGSRTSRATENGYWKSTGKDRAVRSETAKSTGMKKTLVYYQGRAPRGERTDWVMHEYRMEDKVYESLAGRQEPYVLVRVFKKSGAGPKNGEQYGAPFVEEADSPPLRVEDEEIPLELEQPLPEDEVNVELAPGNDESGFFDGILEEFLAEESALTGHGHVDGWDERPGEGFGDDGVLMQEILDTIEGQPQDELWKEAVIDGDAMFDEGFLNGEGLEVPEGLDFSGDAFNFDIEMPVDGPLGEDDFLEINDLVTSDLEGFDAIVGSEIQLQPPRDNAMAMGFDFQGDSARRMLLMRLQPSVSLAGDIADTGLPALSRPAWMFQRSAPSRDFSEFNDLASSSFDHRRPSSSNELQRPSTDTESLDMGREGAGVVPDPDFWSNFEGMPPSLSSEDLQRSVVESQGGTLQPEFPADSWPNFDPPASSQAAKPPSGKGKFLGIDKLLPILPASAAELPDFSSTYVTASDTHVTALTITCSCSKNGAKTVQATLMNYAGGKLHQEVMSGTWKPCAEDCKQGSCVQCIARRPQPQRKVAKGSRSGFVFVFLLGAVSALIWFLLLRGTWKIAQTIYNAIL